MERTIADELADRVANSHGFDKHSNEFNNPNLGQILDISTRQDLEMHIRDILQSQDTKCFTAFSTEQQYRKADIFYHESTNTMVINPYNHDNEPTAYRPNNGFIDFEKKLKESERIEVREITVVHGIQELHPENAPEKTGYELFIQKLQGNNYYSSYSQSHEIDNDIDL